MQMPRFGNIIFTIIFPIPFIISLSIHRQGKNVGNGSYLFILYWDKTLHGQWCSVHTPISVLHVTLINIGYNKQQQWLNCTMPVVPVVKLTQMVPAYVMACHEAAGEETFSKHFYGEQNSIKECQQKAMGQCYARFHFLSLCLQPMLSILEADFFQKMQNWEIPSDLSCS